MGSFLGMFTGGEAPDVQGTPGYAIGIPAKSPEEMELLQNLKQYLKRLMEDPSGYQVKLAEKSQGYLDQLLSDQILTPEETTRLDKEYNLRLQALEKQFARAEEEYGGHQLASLVHRGMLESTVGEQEIARTQEEFFNQLAGAKSELLQEKISTRSDLEAAKRELALSGYQLTQGLSQSQMQTALEASTMLQNYFLGRRGLKSSAELSNALSQNILNQAEYKRKMDFWNSLIQAGTGVAGGAAGG